MDVSQHYQMVATSNECLAGYLVKSLLGGLELAQKCKLDGQQWDQFWMGLLRAIQAHKQGVLHLIYPHYAKYAAEITGEILPELLKADEEGADAPQAGVEEGVDATDPLQLLIMKTQGNA